MGADGAALLQVPGAAAGQRRRSHPQPRLHRAAPQPPRTLGARPTPRSPKPPRSAHPQMKRLFRYKNKQRIREDNAARAKK